MEICELTLFSTNACSDSCVTFGNTGGAGSRARELEKLIWNLKSFIDAILKKHF